MCPPSFFQNKLFSSSSSSSSSSSYLVKRNSYFCSFYGLSSYFCLLYLQLCSFHRLKDQVSYLYKTHIVIVLYVLNFCVFKYKLRRQLCVQYSWLCWFYLWTISHSYYRPTEFLCHPPNFNAYDDLQLWRLTTRVWRRSCKDVELVLYSWWILLLCGW